MTNLETLRHRFGQFLIPLLWAHVGVVAGAEAALTAELPALGPILATACLAGTATLFWLRDRVGTATRLVSGLALVGIVSILVGVFADDPWQIDMHMYFFACLAMLVGWCDWRVILVAAAATAIHHLALSLAVPALVFPGGGGVDLPRVLVHATFVLIETGVLIWLCSTVRPARGRRTETQHVRRAGRGAQSRVCLLLGRAQAWRVPSRRVRVGRQGWLRGEDSGDLRPHFRYGRATFQGPEICDRHLMVRSMISRR